MLLEKNDDVLENFMNIRSLFLALGQIRSLHQDTHDSYWSDAIYVPKGTVLNKNFVWVKSQAISGPLKCWTRFKDIGKLRLQELLECGIPDIFKLISQTLQDLIEAIEDGELVGKWWLVFFLFFFSWQNKFSGIESLNAWEKTETISSRGRSSRKRL